MEHIVLFDKLFWKAVRDNRATIGPIRAYFVVRTLADGRGWVFEDDLDRVGREIGISKRTWKEWKKGALDLGWIWTGANGRLSHLGLSALVRELGCRDVGTQFTIPIEHVGERNFRAWVFAGTQTQFHNPISRRSLYHNTGIPVSTQRRYDNLTGVKRKRNYVVLEGAQAQAVGEKLRRKETQGSEYYNTRGELCKRLPDSRVVPQEVAQYKKYGAKNKLDSALRYEIGSLSNTGEGNPHKARKVRLFFDSSAEYASHPYFHRYFRRKHYAENSHGRRIKRGFQAKKPAQARVYIKVNEFGEWRSLSV